jgi:hypothetical protein
MNIQTVRDNLKNTIAGKAELLTQWEVASTWKDSDKKLVNETIQYLKINLEELKRILQDVEQCVAKDVEQSWRDNPDRSGGQFTQEEIDNADRW